MWTCGVGGGGGAWGSGSGGGGGWGGREVRAEGGTGGGCGHGAVVARLVAPGGAGVPVAGAVGGGWVWAAGPVGGGGGGRAAAVAYLAAPGGVGAVVAGAGAAGRVRPAGGRGRWTWGGGGVRGGARGSGSGGSGVPGGRGGALGEQKRRELVVEARWRCRECVRRGRVCRAGGEQERPRLRDWASSLESGQSGGVGGSWGGGEVPHRPWIRHVGLWWRQWLVVWVEWLSLAGLGPGSPFGVDVVAGGIGFLVRGGVAGTGGLAPGGRWGMRVERSVAAISFACAVRARGVVARWDRVVGSGSVGVGVGGGGVGPLVVTALVVVGSVLRVLPLDPL